MPVWLHAIIGPLVGAVIGYFTNYIAVKMLFRPLRAVKLGNWTLPFTPGLIPKEKDRLACVLGQTVGSTLFTSADIEAALLTEPVKQKVVDTVWEATRSSQPVRELLTASLGDRGYVKAKDGLCAVAAEKLCAAAIDMHLGDIVARESGDAIRRRTKGTVLALAATEGNVTRISNAIAEEVDRFLTERAPQKIRVALAGQLNRHEESTVGELLEKFGVTEEGLRNAVGEIYTDLVRDKVPALVGKIDIAGIVQSKIDAMNVEELEKLTLSVMQKELSAIVNLGALIGFVLGCINLLF